MTSIYTKLREAVERSVLGGTIEVVSEGTNSTVSYNNKTISPYLLLAELKKLEESEVLPRKATKRDISTNKVSFEGLNNMFPPLTKEEKGYYEGLRPKEEWWKTHATQLWFGDVDEDQFEANVGKLVAEARKKALEEVRDEVMSLEKKGDGELWQWRTFKVWLVNKFGEMMK